jgi:transcriptional regulator with XRE-family HTH domain
MTLGEKIRALRTARRWSQRDLAARSGVRQALISYLESGKQDDTTGANLRKLAAALGCTVDYLAGVYNGPADPDAVPGRARFVDGAAPSLALAHTADR